MVIYGARGYVKHYVSVLALHRLDGWVTPIEIIWDDGRRFALDVITEGRRVPCEHTKGNAILFKVSIKGRTKNLYRDDVGWFVEEHASKAPQRPYSRY